MLQKNVVWHAICYRINVIQILSEDNKMKKVLSTLVAAIVAFSFSGIVFAQEAPATAPAPAPAATATPAVPAAGEVKKDVKKHHKKHCKKHHKKHKKEMKKEEAPATQAAPEAPAAPAAPTVK
jgi:Skp family chaperone for outer membrane proteins